MQAGWIAHFMRAVVRPAMLASLDVSSEFFPVAMRVPRPSKAIALTFDDGPHPHFTPRVLDVLAQYKMRATFFVVGDRVVKYPEIVRSIVAAGHALGNHTYTHPRCADLTREEFLNEISRTQAAIADCCPTAPLPRWFRPPWASLTFRQTYSLWREGWHVALWSASCGDRTSSATVEQVTREALRVNSRDILLMHDAAHVTPDVLECLLPALCQRGIQSVTLNDVYVRSRTSRDVTRNNNRTLSRIFHVVG